VKTTFQQAVTSAPTPVNGAYKPGKQALKGEHRALATGAPITIRAGMPQARKLQGAGLDLPQRKLVLA